MAPADALTCLTADMSYSPGTVWMPKGCFLSTEDGQHSFVGIENPCQSSADISPLVSPAPGSYVVAREHGFGGR